MIARYLTPMLTWVLCALIALMPVMQQVAYAAPSVPPAPSPFDDAASQGQAFAKDHMPDPSQLIGRDEDTGQFKVFPDSSEPINITPQELFGDGYGTQQDIEDLYGHEQDIDTATGNARNRLSTQGDATGEAYRTITDSMNRYHADYSNDPIFDTSAQVMEDIFAGEYSACEVTKSMTSITDTNHVPDYKFCSYVAVPEGSCIAHHDYKVRLIEHVSGPFNIQKCSGSGNPWGGGGWNPGSYPANYGCLYMWLGKVGDNYWSGWCSIFEKEIKLKVLNPDAIISASLVYAKWDDYMQVLIDGDKVWSGPNGNFPPETGGDCELRTSWSRSLNTNVTSYFKDVPQDTIVPAKIRVSVAGDGEGYARVRILYDKTKIITDDEWGVTPDCMDMANSVLIGDLEGSLSCVAGSNDPESAVIAGHKIYADWLQPSPFDGISALCKRVKVVADLTANEGGISCWTDPQGEEHCPTNEGSDPDGCRNMKNDNACVFIESECIEGAVLPSGRCFAYTAQYDCGYDVDVPTTDIETEYSCPGEIRCMGGDCLTINTEENNNFAEAVAKLQIADHIAMDMSCPTDFDQGKSIDTCRLFVGEAMECKTAVGGIVDCCKEPQSGISLTDYITLLRAARKVGSLVEGSTAIGEALHGTWTKITQPITDAWGSVTDYFASSLDANSASVPLKKIGLGELKQMAMKKTAEFMAKTFGKQAASLFFENAGEGALFDAAGNVMQGAEIQLGGMIGSALSMVMTVYTIYVVAKLIIQLIWQCTEDELKLGVKRQLKSTHYVGSYCAHKVLGTCVEERRAFCTFSSPLSRILQEQIRPQLGMGWGSPEDPDCSGLTVVDIGQADWSQVDLSEWIGILKMTGNMPENPQEAMGMYSMDQVTANVPLMDFGGSRDNVAERNKKRLSDDETLERNEDLRQELWATGSEEIPFPPPLPEDPPCKPGYDIFYHVGHMQSFELPDSCPKPTLITIQGRAGQSGFASNIQSNPGETGSYTTLFKPTQQLFITVGAAGAVDSQWNIAQDAPNYWGEAGGDTRVKFESDLILDLAGGAKTDPVTQRGNKYFRGAGGYVLITWGGASPTISNWKPKPQEIPAPPKPEPPCDVGSRTYGYEGQVKTFKMPRGCHHLSVIVNGGGGGGGTAMSGSSVRGGGGARVTGNLNIEPKAKLKINVGQGGGTSGAKVILADCHTQSQGKYGNTTTICVPDPHTVHAGSGGGRSVLKDADGTLLVVAGGGGGASAEKGGGHGGRNGAAGKGTEISCPTGGTQSAGGQGKHGGANGVRKRGGDASMSMPVIVDNSIIHTPGGKYNPGGTWHDYSVGWDPGVDYANPSHQSYGGGGKAIFGGGGGGGYYGGGGGGYDTYESTQGWLSVTKNSYCSGGGGSSYVSSQITGEHFTTGGGAGGGSGNSRGANGSITLHWTL